jgi:hypothetical protein
LAEVETARGRIIIQIPMFDADIQKLVVACGKQYENAIKRCGLQDAPRLLMRFRPVRRPQQER